MSYATAIHQLETRLEAARLACGLDPFTGNWHDLEILHERIDSLRNEQHKIEADRQLKRRRHVRGLIKYRAERLAFTI